MNLNAVGMLQELGKQYTLHALGQDEGGRVPHGGLGPKGNMRVQCLRSSADWSSGILTEHSEQHLDLRVGLNGTKNQ